MTTLLKSGVRTTVLFAAFIAAAGTTFAHHGFAVFDTTARRTITGTVKSFEWTNPHTWVWLDVSNAKGGTDTWGFEGMSPNFLGRRGWTRNTLKPGDQITIAYFGMKDGSKGGSFLSGKRPNGEELVMFGGNTTDE